MTQHTETQTGYGVLVTRKDGTKFLLQASGMILFRLSKSSAEAWQESLCLEDGYTSKVVRLKATWEVVE